MLPAATTSVVSKALYPAARTSSRRSPTASGRSIALPTPTRRPSIRISAVEGLVSIRSLPPGGRVARGSGAGSRLAACTVGGGGGGGGGGAGAGGGVAGGGGRGMKPRARPDRERGGGGKRGNVWGRRVFKKKKDM